MNHDKGFDLNRMTRSIPIRATIKSNAGNSIVATIANSTGATYPKVLTLNIGGRIFMVSSDILIAGSGLFRRQLSGRFAWTPQADGSYFLDANPTLFEHLLDFMRRPGIFPLFWSKSDGFNYGLYHRLQAEAEYFQVDALYKWIKDKRYLHAVYVKIAEPTWDEFPEIDEKKLKGNEDEEWYVMSNNREVYICPRGLDAHEGDPDACGRKCRKSQGDNEPEYIDEQYLDVLRVKKEVIFDEKVCQIARAQKMRAK